MLLQDGGPGQEPVGEERISQDMNDTTGSTGCAYVLFHSRRKGLRERRGKNEVFRNTSLEGMQVYT